MTDRSVYVASPLGFSEPGRRYSADVLVPKLEAAGFVVVDPWVDEVGEVARTMQLSKTDPGRLDALFAMNRMLGARNASLIKNSALLLAVLDGCDVDSGTSAEIGFASGLGHPIIGLRTDVRRTGDNDAAVVNLQVLYFIEQTGGGVFNNLDSAIAALSEVARRS
jgi:nucleoside 2-deoxyribosyltransferase